MTEARQIFEIISDIDFGTGCPHDYKISAAVAKIEALFDKNGNNEDTNPFDELYIAAGRKAARLGKLWITKGSSIYCGWVVRNTPVLGAFVGACVLDTTAHRIVCRHNDALFEEWAKYDSLPHLVEDDVAPVRHSRGG